MLLVQDNISKLYKKEVDYIGLYIILIRKGIFSVENQMSPDQGLKSKLLSYGEV